MIHRRILKIRRKYRAHSQKLHCITMRLIIFRFEMRAQHGTQTNLGLQPTDTCIHTSYVLMYLSMSIFLDLCPESWELCNWVMVRFH